MPEAERLSQHPGVETKPRTFREVAAGEPRAPTASWGPGSLKQAEVGDSPGSQQRQASLSPRPLLSPTDKIQQNRNLQ